MESKDIHEVWEMLYVMHLLGIITWDEKTKLHKRMYE